VSAGVLLVAHGSRDPRAAPVAHDAAQALSARLRSVAVAACFLEHAEPTPARALASLRDQGVDAVTVVPFLLTRAYHAGVDLPDVVAAARTRIPVVRSAAVLGRDPLLLRAVRRRLTETATAHDAVVLAAAGSSVPEANAEVEAIAAALGRNLGLPALAGFVTAARPDVATAVRSLRDAGARRVAVATYLLAPGYFGDRIASLARTAGAVAVSAPLGGTEEVADLVAVRVRAASSAG